MCKQSNNKQNNKSICSVYDEVTKYFSLMVTKVHRFQYTFTTKKEMRSNNHKSE